MQRSTKTDPWTYTENLAITDSYPGYQYTGLILLSGIALLSIFSTINNPLETPIPNYFKLKMMRTMGMI